MNWKQPYRRLEGMDTEVAPERWNMVSGGNEESATALRRCVAGSDEQAANVTPMSVVDTIQRILA